MPKANNVQFPDYIPEGQEKDYPAMGAGNRFCDFVPEGSTSMRERESIEDRRVRQEQQIKMSVARSKAAKGE